jgi:hypothetical protein
LLEALGDLQKQALAGHDLSVNVVERTANAFELKRQRWTNTYVAKMRFVASPEGALKRVRTPGRIAGASVGHHPGWRTWRSAGRAAGVVAIAS